MALGKKSIVCLFICLLVFDALSLQALAAPRNGKGKSLSQKNARINNARQNKHIAIPKTILLQKNCGDEEEKNSCYTNSDSSDKSTYRRAFSRCYQTIGSCKATVDEVYCAETDVDTVATRCVNVRTLSTYTTRFNYLTTTKTHRKFLRHVTKTIETYTTIHRSFLTLVPISVTVDVLKTISVAVGKVSNHSALVQTLRTSTKTIRVLTSKETCRRKVTCTEGIIRQVKKVHENIEQSAPRTVTCANSLRYQWSGYTRNDLPSGSCGWSNWQSNNNGRCSGASNKSWSGSSNASCGNTNNATCA